jgi:WD40 repeat protein
MDLVAGAVQGRVAVGTWGRIQQVLHSPAHDFLCGFFEGGTLVTWDAASLELSAVFSPERDDERRPFVCCAVSCVDPYVFVCTAGTKHVNVVDLANRSTFKLRGNVKKPVVAITAHPTQSVLAAVSADGETRLWNYENQSIISFVEGAVPPAPRYTVSFDGAGRYLVVATPSGHVCAWGNQATTADEGDSASLAFLGSAQVPQLASGVDSLVVHPQVSSPPMVLTADHGVVMAWDLVKPEKLKEPVLRASGRLMPFSFRAGVALQCAVRLPPFARSGLAPQSTPASMLLVHPAKNIVTCIPHATFEFGDTA